MKKLLLMPVFAILMFTSCSGLQQVATQVISQTSANSLVNQNAAGLKEALSVGISNTVLRLSKTDGFLGNQALKILLPEEARVISDNLKYVPGGDKLMNDVIIRLNRAAEDAASEAKPIFVSAIRNMSISDATSILFGEKNAATSYLRKSTYSQLTAAFTPKIEASLDKKLVGNISTTQSWNALTSAYNKVAASMVGQVARLRPVNTNLSEYVTQRALDGLFLNLAGEEKLIRENPSARVNVLLQKVFGQLDKKQNLSFISD